MDEEAAHDGDRWAFSLGQVCGGANDEEAPAKPEGPGRQLVMSGKKGRGGLKGSPKGRKKARRDCRTQGGGGAIHRIGGRGLSGTKVDWHQVVNEEGAQSTGDGIELGGTCYAGWGRQPKLEAQAVARIQRRQRELRLERELREEEALKEQYPGEKQKVWRMATTTGSGGS